MSGARFHRTRPPRSRRREAGVGMIELMVAMLIGVVLILGATQMYSDSQAAYAVREAHGRLQETARYALSVIEPDVRMANYWGLLKGASTIGGTTAQTVAANAALGGVSASVCGDNFSLDLMTPLEGRNDGYGLGCAAFNGRPVESADTLTVRRASLNQTAVAAASAGPLRVCATRVSGTLVRVAAACTAAPAGQVYDLLVDTYYVARDSQGRPNVPALRRKSLNATPTFQDDEIVSGIEDMQVQFGIDPAGNAGIVTQYVDPLAAAAIPAGAQIISVRLWLLVRADQREVGFVDGRTYVYGNRAVANGTTADLNAAGAGGKAYTPNDGFRRLLVTRTIMLRNALGT